MQLGTQADDTMLSQIEEQVNRFESLGSEASISLAQAIRSIMTAFEYDDPSLQKSSIENTRQCLIDFAEEQISEAIKISKSSFAFCRESMEAISNRVHSPTPHLDRYGELLQELVQHNLRKLTGLQNSLLLSFEKVVFSGAGPLQNEIQRWRGFESASIKSWPWTSRARKPVDRTMLSEARRSRELGNPGISVEELIQQYRN